MVYHALNSLNNEKYLIMKLYFSSLAYTSVNLDFRLTCAWLIEQIYAQF